MGVHGPGHPPEHDKDRMTGISSAHDLDAAGLRARKKADLHDDTAQEIQEDRKMEADVSWGKTPDGTVFRVPQTTSFVTTLLTTIHRSSLTLWTFVSLIAQPILFYLLRNHSTIRSAFFLVYFAFWRGAYDFGFAWVLRQQSEKRWVVKKLKKWGWLDVASEAGGQEGRDWAKWWQRELEMKMSEGYKWADAPVEFNAWLMFRQLVDVVLLNDFVSYTCFAWSNLHFPPNHSTLTHILRWSLGWSLILFNLWVKIDAHRVVKDYAWYWGDAFWMLVMQNELVFDGVYEIAPHPMYSVGYAGYYGLSMVVGSYSVLFVSLAAHAAQFAFLLWFENPHIERTYGGAQNPLVARTPLKWETEHGEDGIEDVNGQDDWITPEATDGKFSSVVYRLCKHKAEQTGDTENEAELPRTPTSTATRKARSASTVSLGGDKAMTMHDLNNRYFRKPAITFWRLDIFRATDFALITLAAYGLAAVIPALPARLSLIAYFLHALAWRLFHSFGLGLLLDAQSKSKWYVRHFLKHYHYRSADNDKDNKGETDTVVNRATEEAFGNWQVVYNISLVMTYVSFISLAWKTYHLPHDWTVSGTILRHVLGLLLIFLHIWSAHSSYEALGDFGWLYSDFFLTRAMPSQLAYTGIYRFLNNPERSMGGAAFFGMWLMSNSKLVLALALISHLSHWWYLSAVEKPHMQRLYGDRLRKDGGLSKTLKTVAGRTLGPKAGPDVQRVVGRMQNGFSRVEERVSEAVEEFLGLAKPKLSGMMNDTKVLLQQSRERMIITRVASDLSAYDRSRYAIHCATSSSTQVPRFHVGQPIQISWTAPSNHSRKDWIGIYRLGSCKAALVTKISSVGKWMPIYDDEWEGDQQVDTSTADDADKKDAGTVVFRGDRLPWSPGQYELRYHHDGKHNVMSRIAPIEIYVNKPKVHTFVAVHDTLLDIVTLSLDGTPALLPQAAKAKKAVLIANLSGVAFDAQSGPPDPMTDDYPQRLSAVDHTMIDGAGHPDVDNGAGSNAGDGGDGDDRNADDFIIMNEHQAKRIASLCQHAFDVDLSTDVIIGDANVSLLAKRIVGSRSLITGYSGGSGIAAR